ncbi:response regulator transcription factor [Phytoactinopolyspora mesophila]|uniref:Response regulator n=1 Tax=Phytoactinopolyspora mesophila TaxID=2650750 RepID=A0A7K3MB69_9ACTN|nr:response regulator transcription factor [Phytoactinopolyspora mesophila]NDL60559.1 response regulator [Phytoactinopolyspora mesophila]
MRVLVVEDEAPLAAAIDRGLRAEGFEVEVVGDGLEGYWRGRERPYGAIVLDILLPGMNGYVVCRKLRADGVSTPILMLTAKDGEYDEADALDLGADDYLRKPCSYVVLVARLRALQRRGGTVRPAILVAGDLYFDPASRRCRRDNTPISLSAREASLLEYLLVRDGDPVDKYELLDGVWGADQDHDPNVVEVYIGYLRRKIDRPFGRNSIQTVRGVGYRVVDEVSDADPA